jgi:hypothetical protein
VSLKGVAAGNPPAPVGVVRRDRLLVACSAMFALAAVGLDWQRRQAGADPLPATRLLASAYAAFAAAAIVSAMLDRARRDEVRRGPVRLLALAGGLIFGGQALGYLATAGQGGIFDSRVEAIPLLVALPVVGYALLRICLPRGMTRQERRVALIDSTVAVLALAIIWWQAVVPDWIDDERFGFWVHLNQVLIFGALAVTVVITVVSRRIGSLPFVQLALLVSGMAVYLVSDFLGQVVRGLDDTTSVTYSIPGYLVAICLLVAFAHRPPVEVETVRDRQARELVSAALPLVLALGAGGLVIAAAAPDLVALAPLLALITWALLLLGVLVARLTSSYELRRAQASATASLLADRTREG